MTGPVKPFGYGRPFTVEEPKAPKPSMSKKCLERMRPKPSSKDDWKKSSQVADFLIRDPV